MRRNRLIAWVGLLIATPAGAQESFKIEALKEGPPAALAAPVKGVMEAQGFRVVDGQGKGYADFWLRKGIPASSKPGGPKGTVQFPILAEGEILGALRFAGEGRDYRDQSIPKGTYTVRYGLQPVNGDHLGVSEYRDYVLLLPAAKDVALANLAARPLQERSAESAGTSHPAVLMLLAAPGEAAASPTMVHDEAKNTWGAVVPLSLALPGDAPASLPVRLILIGAAMN